MKLVNLPEAICQLNNLARIQNINITTEILIDSIFYKALNRQTTLDISYSTLTSAALILASKIVVVSFTLRILNISWNNFEEYGAAVARAIVKSNTLTSVELEDFDDLDPKPKSEMARIFTDHNVLAIYHQIIVPNLISEIRCDTLPKETIDLIGEYAYIPFIEFTI
jgi:hypothetical protein